MEETYTTSADLTAAERLCALCCGGLFLICCLCAAGSFNRGAAMLFASYSRLAIDLGLTVVFLGLVRLTLTREIRETAWIMGDGCVTKRNPYRIVTIDFGQVVRFRYIRIPFLFRYGVLRFQGGIAGISFRTQNLHGLIAALRESLVAAGKADVFDENNIRDFLLEAHCAGLSSRRLARLMPYYAGALMLLCAMSTLTALFLWRFPFSLSFFWSVFSLLLYLAGIVSAEFVIAFYLKRAHAAQGTWPVQDDAGGLYLFVGTIFLVLYLSCGMALKALFQS
jgi:hypothetical protein